MNYCVVCRNQKSKKVFSEFDVLIVKCTRCGHVYSTHKATQDYQDYFKSNINEEDHYWWKEAHERMYNTFCEKYVNNKSGKLLDVGCGLGYFVKKASAYTSWEVFGYEISPVAVAFAKDKLKLKNVIEGRVEDSRFPQKHFDIITLWDVIEHIPDPFPILNYLKIILKDNGKLFLHTPNVCVQIPKAKLKKIIKGMQPDGHYLEAKDHLNIYSPKTIRILLSQVGFDQVKFIHLPPIQSVAGSKSWPLRKIKNIWYKTAKLIDFLSLGKINIDNLFVIAVK